MTIKQNIIIGLVSLVVVAGASAYMLYQSTPNRFFQSSVQCKDKDYSEMSHRVMSGFSMLPTAKEGDIILTVPYDNTKPVVYGERIEVERDGLNVMHTVCSKQGQQIVLCPDNGLVKDENIYRYSDIKSIGCGVLWK